MVDKGFQDSQTRAGTQGMARGLVLMVLCTLFTAAGQIFYKLAAIDLNSHHVLLVEDWPLLVGVVLYGIGAVFLLLALKHGQLSVLYPVLAVSYIWVGIGAPLVLHREVMTPDDWIGVGLVVLGVVLVGIGGSVGGNEPGR